MSRGLNATDVPDLVRKGIKAAFVEWEEMSDAWLHTAPEYHLTVSVAQALAGALPRTKRRLVMEGPVAQSLESAGAKQKGAKAQSLRHAGRYDIVLGNAQGIPRIIIEVKNRVWHPNGALVTKDMVRICESLLRGVEKSNLVCGIFAFYRDAMPTLRGGESASQRLERKFGTSWRKQLRTWDWAPRNRRKAYADKLLIDVVADVEPRQYDGEEHAWAAVSVAIKRCTKRAAQ